MIRLIAFSERGKKLADRLAGSLGGSSVRCGKEGFLDAWVRSCFAAAEGMVFVGAAGIAVRAIAPHVRSKAADPPVVVVDEMGRYAIPVLSGHLGGANDLARQIARILGAEAVITTATDLRRVFSVDEWARRQGCRIVNPARIKTVSAALLDGKEIRVWSEWPIEGSIPEGIRMTEKEREAEVCLTVRRGAPDTALLVVPQILAAGIGCRKGITQEQLESFFTDKMEQNGFLEEAVGLVCSIDRKKEEAGLLRFCEKRNLPVSFFSARELSALEGDFTASEYVRNVTGVDNVCERSAVLGSHGILKMAKQSGNGITMAIAAAPFRPDWHWRME